MVVQINKPTIGGDPDDWGQKLNDALDIIVSGVNAEEAARLAAITDLQNQITTATLMN